MSDLISRQAAIDAIEKNACNTQRAIEAIMALSSVQSKQKNLSDWKEDFKGYINALNIPKDDYNEIMEYIDEIPSIQLK